MARNIHEEGNDSDGPIDGEKKVKLTGKEGGEGGRLTAGRKAN